MSRRAAREQETTTFLQQNPHLIEYDTRIAPAQDSHGRYVLEVTRNDNDPVQTEAPGVGLFPPQGALPGVISVESEVEAPGADLDASYTYSDWKGRPKEGDASVSISELGIGVTSGGDVINLVKEILKKDLGPEDLAKFGTISDNESLEVEVGDDAPDGAVTPDPEMFPFLGHYGREVGIDFDVISGSGKIEITLLNSDTGESMTQEFDTFVMGGRARRPVEIDIDHIDAEMGHGRHFDSILISTTGDLEITVTGIDLTSGYAETGIF